MRAGITEETSMTVTYELTGFILWSVAIYLAGYGTRYVQNNRRTMFDHWKHIHPIETLKHDLRELQGK